jgi:hypothetical protein
MAQVDSGTVKKVLLEVVAEYNKVGPGYFQSGPILNEAARRLGR